jgi:hypothetical protein
MGNEFLTLADQAKRTDPSGNVLTIVEMINQTNELDDIPSVPSNGDTEMIATRRVGLPAATRRKINEGVKFSKSKTEPYKAPIVMYESHGAVDCDLVDMAADKEAVRLSENSAHIQSLGEAFAEDLFYGSEANDTFTGFFEAYKDKKSEQFIDAGGTTNLTSIMIAGWAPDKITTFFPKNSKAGIVHEPLPKGLIKSADGEGELMAYADVFKWKVGLAIQNPKFASRIANIDVKNINKDDIFTLLIKAKNRIPNLKIVRPRIYCCQEIFTILELAAFNKTNAVLTYREVKDSTPVLTFGPCEIKRIDAIKTDEKKVA